MLKLNITTKRLRIAILRIYGCSFLTESAENQPLLPMKTQYIKNGNTVINSTVVILVLTDGLLRFSDLRDSTLPVNPYRINDAIAVARNKYATALTKDLNDAFENNSFILNLLN